MMRIMLLTFGFLTWGWYELSGGSDFVAGQNGVELMAKAKPVQHAPVKADTQVTRTNTDLTSISGFATMSVRVSQPVETSGVVQPAVVQVAAAPVVEPQVTQAPRVIQASSGDLNSLQQQIGAAVSASLSDSAPVIDYRRVSGQRVNLRGGPSTGHAVVTQLLQGEEVEVLDDAGDGWVQLRALDGNDIGWMSDKFLTRVN